MVASLRDQRPVAPLHLRDVADQHRGTGAGAVHHQRQRAQQHRRAAGVDLHPHALAAGQQVEHVLGQLLRLERVRDQRSGHLDQVATLQLAGQPHPVIGRQGVGAGVRDVAVDVQPDEAVAHPRRGARHGHVPHVGKGALGQHVDEVHGAVPVGGLEMAGHVVGRQGGLVPGQDRHHLVVISDRGGRHVVAGQGRRAFLRPDVFQVGVTGGEGFGDERRAIGGEDAAHHVGLQHRGRGRGPALRHAHQHAVVAADPHQVVGERQVGQQLPLPDHGVQMVHRVARQHRVLGEQITESGHQLPPSRSPATDGSKIAS